MNDIYNQFTDFKSFEVVFIDNNGNPQKIFCAVKRIGNDNIVLSSNNEQNKNIFAKTGDELKLHVYTDNGIYSATSKVLNLEKGIINTEYVIVYPTNSKHSQRREYFRADMKVKFKMNVVTNNEKNESFTITSETRNICGKGLSFISNEDFPNYDSAEIELFFDEKIITTSANFVYSKQIVSGNHPKFILAFMFRNISVRDIDFIVKKCFLYQLEERKKHIE